MRWTKKVPTVLVFSGIVLLCSSCGPGPDDPGDVAPAGPGPSGKAEDWGTKVTLESLPDEDGSVNDAAALVVHDDFRVGAARAAGARAAPGTRFPASRTSRPGVPLRRPAEHAAQFPLSNGARTCSVLPLMFTFGPFRFDPAAGLVYRGGEETLLPPKAARVLQLLVESAGQLVSKEELLETIWEDAFVTESSLTDAISLVRRTLDDDTRDPTYIQTIHRRGYRFIAPANELGGGSGGARVEVDGPATAANGDMPESTADTTGVGQGRRGRGAMTGWLVVAAVVVAAASVAVWIFPRSAPPAEPRVSMTIKLTEQALTWGNGSAVALSPDGSHIAFAVRTLDGQGLYLRRLAESDDQQLVAGPVRQPFFSPDGLWVGYWSDGQLLKIPLNGGTPLPIAEVAVPWGISWGADETVVFSAGLWHSSTLFRVPASGGDPEPITVLADGEATHRWPQVLPGSESVLLTVTQAEAEHDTASMQVLDLRTLERQEVHQGGYYARYVSTGHLLYVSSNALFAVAFDLETRERTGTGLAVVEGVSASSRYGTAEFDVAGNGTLIYVPNDENADVSSFVVDIDPQGRAVPVWDPGGIVASPKVSPDGKRLVAVLHGTEAERDGLWVFDIEEASETRIFSSGETAYRPMWTRDSSAVIFGMYRDGSSGIYRVRADGSGQVQELLTSDGDVIVSPNSTSLDGDLLYYVALTRDDLGNLHELRLDGERDARPLVVTEHFESNAQLSPDGNWLLYNSDRSGETEVYLRPYPVRDENPRPVSEGGGAQAQWSGDGTEIYYRTDTGVAVVHVDNTGSGVRLSRPEELFQGDFPGRRHGVRLADTVFGDFSVAPDGEHLYMIQTYYVRPPGPVMVEVVLNWSPWLARSMPVGDNNAQR